MRPPSLLEAADSYPRIGAQENRLTEIFAEVLRTSPRLTAWVLRQGYEPADVLPPLTDAYIVTTQFMLASGSERPDMRISQTGVARHLYIENKIDAVLTAAQRDGYPAVGAHGLLVIMPSSRDGDELPKRFKRLTWDQVAHEAYRLGAEWADGASDSATDWRQRARRFDAPAEYRLLAELTWYLERELSVTVGTPIQPTDVAVIAGADAALTRWDTLQRLLTTSLGESPGWRSDTKQYGRASPWHAELPVPVGSHAVGWDIRLEGRWPAFEAVRQNALTGEIAGPDWALASVIMDSTASWIGPSGYSVGPPAIGAGMSVGIDGDWPWGLRDGGTPHGQVLRREAEQRGFTFGATWKGTIGRVFKTKLLGELPPRNTLEEQAEDAAQWIRDVLAEIQSIGSGEPSLPSAPTWQPPDRA